MGRRPEPHGSGAREITTTIGPWRAGIKSGTIVTRRLSDGIDTPYTRRHLVSLLEVPSNIDVQIEANGIERRTEGPRTKPLCLESNVKRLPLSRREGIRRSLYALRKRTLDDPDKVRPVMIADESKRLLSNQAECGHSEL